MSLARSEMAEQPAVLDRLLRESAGAIAAAGEEIAARRPRFGVIAARGSSDNAARYAQHLFGRYWGMPVALATPSLHTLYDASLNYRDALVLGISQSGASPDVAGVVAAANEQGAITIAITNEPDSLLGRSATHVIALRTGPERSVAATKTYTASLGAIAALAGVDDEELAQIPDAMARQLGVDVPFEAAAGWERLAVVGRGVAYGTAFEAALKLSELTGVIAAPWSSADFMHGPIAIVEPGFPILAIAPSGPTLDGMRELLDAASSRGADVTVISDAPLAGRRIALEPVPEWLSPLVAVIPAQLLAVGAAEHLGRDVDRPTGLQKVTLTS
ncbi:SIS domain-containing protein [Solirubrobacter ginsenosidimutans]|uniref:SIS domain-containing protein n=1 Tax=Solirubrobacter ginsenosidimutans TaxID=490573 RepID=A0A9X3MWJ4_9ACTN|nr:SIS domain-containing protein [Solirubrobacter ginsenosidimutans]MDA0163752.1 SIS domain-containing protein [Solirubrobacter ginsenosidimutans]